MKLSRNIHILPTDKPSRLLYSFDNKLCLTDIKMAQSFGINKVNIYITSNKEIKGGDYVYHTQMFNYIGFTGIARVGKQRVNQEFEITSLNGQHSYYSCKEPKVILTTDPDLIKDGVQAIDDDFLEWFVKNPSCEFVEVETFEVEDYVGFAGHTGYPTFHNEYKIIIPQEEPKQCCDSGIVDDFCINTLKCKHAIEISKQETLEEAAENFVKVKQFRTEEKDKTRLYSFIQGSKWQAERMYSEEDLREAFKAGGKMSWTDISQETQEPYYYDFNEWFEQFKKK
jgi:hypothetical protein